MTDKMISIKTSRYSTLLRRIFAAYNSSVDIRIDGQSYGEGDIDALLSSWCTNRAIRRTLNFELARDGRVLFAFHDSPEELWAAYSELPFVHRLREERILRYQVMLIGTTEPSRLRALLVKVWALVRERFRI